MGKENNQNRWHPQEAGFREHAFPGIPTKELSQIPPLHPRVPAAHRTGQHGRGPASPRPSLSRQTPVPRHPAAGPGPRPDQGSGGRSLPQPPTGSAPEPYRHPCAPRKRGPGGRRTSLPSRRSRGGPSPRPPLLTLPRPRAVPARGGRRAKPQPNEDATHPTSAPPAGRPPQPTHNSNPNIRRPPGSPASLTAPPAARCLGPAIPGDRCLTGGSGGPRRERDGSL
ncbi:PREDICTED: proline-rich protein HaeIII subfamily 1-like [Calidris pugnax]|uniref:proline-rich protein HaeIII subfamily 1-like n=1 Tax=Calidris pugnax TaxID=198806 RepID=UPI00071DEF49|nr:PREDICTED: proline-rich protein HaeIII subfamily 1-like [Calidris pugnax]